MRANRIGDFLFCLLTEFEFYIVGVGASRPAWVGELTHMRSVCVNPLDAPKDRQYNFFILSFFHPCANFH